VLGLIVAALCAYALARLPVPGKSAVLGIILGIVAGLTAGVVKE